MLTNKDFISESEAYEIEAPKLSNNHTRLVRNMFLNTKQVI
jgi:hypothetical protein